jgi:sphinganine-1-phosphate aldolase
MKIPQQGQSAEALFQSMEEIRQKDMDWRSGRTWAYVYDAGRQAETVAKQAYVNFLSESGLDPTVYPSLLRFENDVVSMAIEHLRGNNDVVGNFTSGGTESIMLAVKTARDYMRHHRPEITQPEIILPITAHAAFHKAASYLDVKLVTTAVTATGFIADMDAMAKAITPNTILLVGSAPSYGHGVVDPIVDIAKLAQKHNILCHVDACLGGFLLPFWRKLGHPMPDFDWQVPGVTSMSMDFHKYGFCPKGASVVMYRDKELRRFQIFACSEWTGYTIVNNTIQSTKTGGPLAAAWAVLQFLGQDGYMELAKTMLEGTKRLLSELRSIPELRVLGEPMMNQFGVASDTINVFELIDVMRQKDWYIQPQLSFANSPENFHLSVNPSNVPHMEAFLVDLKQSVAELSQRTPNPMAAGLVQMASQLTPEQLDDTTFDQLLGTLGAQSNEIPQDMALINQVLNAIPRKVSKEILIEYVNRLYRSQNE